MSVHELIDAIIIDKEIIIIATSERILIILIAITIILLFQRLDLS